MAFIDELEAAIRETKTPVGTISDSTISVYIANLKRLFTLITGQTPGKLRNLVFLKNTEKVMDAIKDFAESTYRNYLNTIVKVLGLPRYKRLYASQLEFYTNKRDAIQDTLNNKANFKTDTQKENWVEVEELKEAQAKYKAAVDTWFGKTEITMRQYNELLNYLIVSLYIDVEPRRAVDYYTMKAVETVKEATEGDENYYVRKGNKFIFRNYKTVKTYGEVVVKIPRELESVIYKFKKYKPASEYFLVKANGKPFGSQPDFSRAVSLAYGKYIPDKQISINLIRNIRGTHDNKDHKEAMEKKAKEMGTSVHMLNTVYTKTD